MAFLGSPRSDGGQSAPGTPRGAANDMPPNGKLGYEAQDDWPTAGPIDLKLHDLPHASSSIEWWYHNAHIQTTCGKDISFFSSFFRIVTGYDKEAEQLECALARQPQPARTRGAGGTRRCTAGRVRLICGGGSLGTATR